jgi:hypothetical protein
LLVVSWASGKKGPTLLVGHSVPILLITFLGLAFPFKNDEGFVVSPNVQLLLCVLFSGRVAFGCLGCLTNEIVWFVASPANHMKPKHICCQRETAPMHTNTFGHIVSNPAFWEDAPCMA